MSSEGAKATNKQTNKVQQNVKELFNLLHFVVSLFARKSREKAKKTQTLFTKKLQL